MLPQTQAKILIDGDNCTHYNKKGHTHDTCIKLHGYLAWWKERKRQNQRASRLNTADQDESFKRVATTTVELVASATALNIA